MIDDVFLLHPSIQSAATTNIRGISWEYLGDFLLRVMLQPAQHFASIVFFSTMGERFCYIHRGGAATSQQRDDDLLRPFVFFCHNRFCILLYPFKQVLEDFFAT